MKTKLKQVRFLKPDGGSIGSVKRIKVKLGRNDVAKLQQDHTTGKWFAYGRGPEYWFNTSHTMVDLETCKREVEQIFEQLQKENKI